VVWLVLGGLGLALFVVVAICGGIIWSVSNQAGRAVDQVVEDVKSMQPAPPPMQPPPAGRRRPGRPALGGRSSADAIKISGDVFSFVQTAVQENRLTDVDIRGFPLGKERYRDVPAEGGVLIGFQFGLEPFFDSMIIKSLRPIFLTKTGERFGSWHGKEAALPATVKARPGYVVSGLSMRTGLALDAATVTFAKLGKDGLDLADSYTSATVGGKGGNPSTIGGKGALFVGVTGHLSDDRSPCSLGLVAVLPKQ
jgi:hypothetical protein